MSTTRHDTRSRVTADLPGAVRTTETADGRRVAYAEFGDPDGEPLLFFHGTPGSRLLGELYDEPARRRGVRVLSVDRPGYGQSESRPGRTPATVNEFVEPVLDDAGVSRAGVVGFSGGGIYALALAETRPDLVTGVDLVSGAVPPSLGETPRVLSVLSTLAGSTPRLLGGIYRAQAWAAGHSSPSFVLSQFTTEDAPDEVPDDVAELVREDFLEAFASTRSGAVTESRLFTGDWGVSLDRVEPTVRLHHGDRDTNVPVEGVRTLADELPDARLREYDGADHVTALVRSRETVIERYAE